MPKISKFGGPTNFGLNEAEAGFVEPPLTPPADWVRPQNQADADLQDGAPVVTDPQRTAGDDEVSEAGQKDGQAASVAAPFDPKDYSVKDVVAELDGMDPAERNAVIEAERSGKARPGILNA